MREFGAGRLQRNIPRNHGLGLRVVGRLDTAEAERPEYGFLTAAGRGRAGILKPGTMIVQQPEIPAPLLVPGCTVQFDLWVYAP